MKNSEDQGGCYPQRPKAEVDNTLRDLQNSSYPTKAEFNNCFIIHSKYFPVLKNNIISSSGFLGQPFNNLQRAAGKKSKIKFCIIVFVSVKLLMLRCKSSSKSEWVESKYFSNVIGPITFATLSIRRRAGSNPFHFGLQKTPATFSPAQKSFLRQVADRRDTAG